MTAAAAGARAGGFSLLEVLLAALILGLGLAGIMEGMTLALQSHGDSERSTTAILLADGLLEEICAAGLPPEGESEGDFGDLFPRYAWTRRVEPIEPAGLHEVRVAIRWREGEREAEIYELTTFIFEAPISAGAGLEPARGDTNVGSHE